MMKIRLLTLLLLVTVLLNALFFVNKVSADEGDEDIEIEIVEEEETEGEEEEEEEVEHEVEVIQVIEYVEPEIDDDDEEVFYYPERHLSGTSSSVEVAMVESLKRTHMDWYNALADGSYDYALLYNHELNRYHMAVLNDDEFSNGLGFWYVLETNSSPGIEGVRLRGSGENAGLQNPATFYFDGTTGELTSAVLPGNSFEHNLTHFGGSYMIATTLPYGQTPAYSNAAITIPRTSILGHEWAPLLEHAATRIEGGGLYDIQTLGILLFILFVGWFVGHFRFGYFAPQG